MQDGDEAAFCGKAKTEKNIRIEGSELETAITKFIAANELPGLALLKK